MFKLMARMRVEDETVVCGEGGRGGGSDKGKEEKETEDIAVIKSRFLEFCLNKLKEKKNANLRQLILMAFKRDRLLKNRNYV